MGTTLTGTTPQDTYDSLIKVTDNGPLSGTAKYLSDGLGNDSTLALSTSAVGIGTTAPQRALHVNGFEGVLRLTSTASGNNGFEVGIGVDSQAFLWQAEDSYIQIATNGTERMRITSTGNVGIGTSSPATFGLLGIQATNAATKSGIGISVNTNGTTLSPYTNALLEVFSTGGGAGSGIYSINTYSDNSRNEIAFRTSAVSGAIAERVRITESGLTFNGDTAAANALDDYEEGTWTMGVAFGGASVGVTYNANVGTYTKIGRQVTVNGYLDLTSKGSSVGSATITGLPFTIPNLNQNYSAVSLWFNAITFADQFIAIGAVNTTTISLQESSMLGVNTPITDADFANNSAVMVSLTYFV